MISFQSPVFLWFLLSIPILISLHFFSLHFSRRKAVKFANFEAIKRVGTGLYSGSVLSKNLVILFIRLCTLTAIVLAISGLTLWTMESQISEVAIALDASGSMLASDIPPTRLEAAKETAIGFIDTLDSTRIGVLSFSGVAHIQTKPTTYKEDAIQGIRGITIQSASGTAIGDAMISAINMLETPVIVLITDGQSTVGSSIDDALSYAKEKKATIHTIGVATEQGDELSGLLSQIDSQSLQRIATETGGNYYQAGDRESFREAYSEISQTAEHETPHNMTSPLLIAAITLMFIEWILVNLRYRTIP
ncbi:MAG: VWA domain-containing protein [Candidatus Woesearchaeota archaeon]